MSYLDNLKWLLRKDEIEFEKHSFKGKLAGKEYQYSQSIDALVRTRIVIFTMSILIFYPVLMHYLYGNTFDFDFDTVFLIERGIFSVIFLIAGFRVRPVAFLCAILFMLGAGIYHNIRSQKLRAELETTLLENQLVD